MNLTPGSGLPKKTDRLTLVLLFFFQYECPSLDSLYKLFSVGGLSKQLMQWLCWDSKEFGFS